MTKRPKDAETVALHRCLDLLSALPKEQAARILSYLADRFNFDDAYPLHPNSPDE